MLCAYVAAVGVLGPGLSGWEASAPILRGSAPYVRSRTELPQPAAALPAAERRRAGRMIRLALAVGSEAVASAQVDPSRLASVFSSSAGDGDNCHQICETLASSDRSISPTRFHNSVHNAAAGYWSIAQGCIEPSTALCAHDASFGAGLLESLAQLASGTDAVLLISYEVDYPPPMRACRPIPDAFGVALLLRRSAADKPCLGVRLTDAAATPMRHVQLEQLRRAIPAARALPLLERLAATPGGEEPLILDYLDGTRLAVELHA